MQLIDYRKVARVPAMRINYVGLRLKDFIIVVKVLVLLLNSRKELLGLATL